MTVAEAKADLRKSVAINAAAENPVFIPRER
jgi:hypothetical protein